MQSPTPEQIKQARTEAGLTQTHAAKIIYCSLGAWQKWELGSREMHPAFWELFLIKTGDSKMNSIKKTLIAEARFQAAQIQTDRAAADHFCKKYFAHPKDKKLMNALSKGADCAEKWINENY